MEIQKANLSGITFSLQSQEGIPIPISAQNKPVNVDKIQYENIIVQGMAMARKLNIKNFTLSLDFDLDYEKSTTSKLRAELRKKLTPKNIKK